MKKPKVIQRGKESEDWYCRKCNFSGSGISGGVRKAKLHSEQTGHTVDVYYETRREITYYEKGKNTWTNPT